MFSRFQPLSWFRQYCVRKKYFVVKLWCRKGLRTLKEWKTIASTWMILSYSKKTQRKVSAQNKSKALHDFLNYWGNGNFLLLRWFFLFFYFMIYIIYHFDFFRTQNWWFLNCLKFFEINLFALPRSRHYICVTNLKQL